MTGAGDREAFGQLVAQYQAQVFSLASWLARAPQEAAALARDVFIDLHAALPRITGPEHLRHWLLRAATQRSLGWLRHQAPWQGLPDEPSSEPSAESRLRGLLWQLEPQARAAVLLHDQQQLEVAEIAAILDVPAADMQASLQSSLEWLRAQYAAEVDPGQYLRACLAPVDPGPDFTARVVARVELRWSHRRAAGFAGREVAAAGFHRRRFIVAGSVAALAIGAVLLCWWWPVAPHRPAPAISAPRPAATRQSGRTAIPVAQPAEAAATPPPAATEASSPAWYPYRRYVVVALPLRQDLREPASRPAVEAFYTALLDDLGRLPSITLLVPGTTAPPLDDDQPPDYLLSVSSSQPAAGGMNFRFGGGRGVGAVWSPAGAQSAGVVTLAGTSASPAAGQWPVEIRVQALGQPEVASFTSALQVGDASAGQLAAQQLDVLRRRVFPDELVKLQLMARLGDASLPGFERSRALGDLLDIPGNDRGQQLDGVDVAAIADFSAVLPSQQRAQLWRSLRGMSQPDLLGPLVESLRRDPEQGVRYEALATLAAGFRNDPRARSAIESVAQDDAQPVIRMAARRVLNGDAEWRRYVVATLKDASLSCAERLAPLLLAARSAASPAESRAVRQIVSDPEITGLLGALVQQGWYDVTQADSVGDALGLLANGGTQAAFDLSVEVLQDGSRPAPVPVPVPAPPPVPRPQVQISPATMTWMMRHRADPDVQRVMRDLATGNADPQLGGLLEQMQRRAQRP